MSGNVNFEEWKFRKSWNFHFYYPLFSKYSIKTAVSVVSVFLHVIRTRKSNWLPIWAHRKFSTNFQKNQKLTLFWRFPKKGEKLLISGKFISWIFFIYINGYKNFLCEKKSQFPPSPFPRTENFRKMKILIILKFSL